MRYLSTILAILLCTIGLSVKAQTLSVENDILEWEVDKIKIRMFFMEDDKNTIPYVFHVTALTKKS